MRTIIYVHGAGASAYSFSFLRQQLLPHQSRYFNYSFEESTEACSHRLGDTLAQETEPVILIGHSLGGVIARVCANHSNVSHLITLCAPFGGIKGMSLVSIFNRTPLFHDLSTYSSLLSSMRESPIAVPHLAIVASRGLPYTSEPNDGVVTLASQTALLHSRYVDFDLNHFEVLLSPEVATTINQFLSD